MRSPRIFLFILSILILYTYGKAAQLLPRHPVGAIGLAALFLVVMLSGTFVYRAKPQVYDQFWFRLLSWTGSVAMGLWATFIILSLPFDIVRVLIYAIGSLSGKEIVATETFTALYFWIGTAAIAFVTLGFFQAVRGPVVRELTVYVENLHPALQGFRIAQISDLHIGATIRKPYVEEVVRRTNKIAPNLVVLTGDIVDGHADSMVEHLEPLSRIEATHGRYYITGNHEYYWNASAILKRIEQMGIQTLINSGSKVTVGEAKLGVGGITDPMGEHALHGHTPDIEKAVGETASADFKILLSHRPGVAEAAARAGADLQFSGHTHSGQFFPFNLFIGFAHAYSRGLYRHGKMWVYVNPGTGYWGPANRFGVPPEISAITLKREEKA